MLGKKSPDLRLTRQLYLANAFTALAFLLLVIIIIVTFNAVEKRSIGVIESDMERVVNNSAVVREITTLFGEIDVLDRAFYGNDEYLGIEGERLLRHVDEIARLSENSRLQRPLQALADELERFLARCTAVNASLQTRNAIDREIAQQLDKLENLISRLLIDATLAGDDTAYITQLLALVIGYNESFLVIGKLYAEFDRSAHDAASRGTKLRVLDAIDDLTLRLRTITASTPEVSQQGRRIVTSVTRYKDSVSKVFEEIQQLNAERSAMTRTRVSLLAALEDIDSRIAAGSRLAAESVDSIFLISTTTVLVVSIAIVSAIFLLTLNLVRYKIVQPIRSILSGIDSFSRGKLDNRIELSRVDEWKSIGDALNKMAADLSVSRAELQSANLELENRVKLRTLELAEVVTALSDSEASLNEAQSIAHLGHWIWEIEPAKTIWSDEQYRIYGLEPSQIEPSFDLFIQQLHPQDREQVLTTFVNALIEDATFKLEYRIIRNDGRQRWIAAQGHVHRDEDGGSPTMAGTSLDVTERKNAEILLVEEKERALVTLLSIGDAVITTDAVGSVEYLNPVAEKLTGFTSALARGLPLFQVFNIVNEDTRKRAEDPVARCLREGKVIGLANHTVLISKSGEEYAIQDSAAPIQFPGGEIIGVVLVFRDVTEARQLSREVSYQASHDKLTGLINRHELERRLTRVVDTVQTMPGEHAFCYLDLDQFKLVNDSCGHMAGDELLRQISNLLQEHIRYRDSLARLGGDEFGLLLEYCSLAEAEKIAGKLVQAVADYEFLWEEKRFRIGVSIGLVMVNEFSESTNGVLRAADSACYAAKDQGRNRIHVFEENDEALSKRRGEMQWAVRLPHALDDGKFRLFAQPMVSVDSETNEGSHYEVLLRLQDDQLIMPSTFFPAADRYNLTSRLDRWVIGETFKWIADHPAHLERLHLCAINLSGHSLNEEEFLDFIHGKFMDLPIPPAKICFEITETVAIANLTRAANFMRTLKARGCCFALDDFGSGLSSFAYLKNLPVDFLKIDGLFVKDMVNNPLDLAMVKSINEIGRVMGKQTVAECVENDATLDKMREIGVDYAQGFGIAQPRPIEELL